MNSWNSTSSSSSDEYDYLRPDLCPEGTTYNFMDVSEYLTKYRDVMPDCKSVQWINSNLHSSARQNSEEEAARSTSNGKESSVDINQHLSYASVVAGNCLNNDRCSQGVTACKSRVDLVHATDVDSVVLRKPVTKDMDCQTVITGDVISLNLHHLDDDGDTVLTPTRATPIHKNSSVHSNYITLEDIQNILTLQGNDFSEYANDAHNENMSEKHVKIVSLNDEGMGSTESIARLSEPSGDGQQEFLTACDVQDEEKGFHTNNSSIHLNDEGMGSSESISHLSNNETEEDMQRSNKVQFEPIVKQITTMFDEYSQDEDIIPDESFNCIDTNILEKEDSLVIMHASCENDKPSQGKPGSSIDDGVNAKQSPDNIIDVQFKDDHESIHVNDQIVDRSTLLNNSLCGHFVENATKGSCIQSQNGYICSSNIVSGVPINGNCFQDVSKSEYDNDGDVNIGISLDNNFCCNLISSESSIQSQQKYFEDYICGAKTTFHSVDYFSDHITICSSQNDTILAQDLCDGVEFTVKMDNDSCNDACEGSRQSKCLKINVNYYLFAYTVIAVTAHLLLSFFLLLCNFLGIHEWN